MLRQDLNLSLGVGEGELAREDGGLDIAALWKTVERAVKDIAGWEVRHEVVLALFSFAKHLMWKDLAERTDQLRANPVVRHLLDTPREPYASEVSFPEPKCLDREYGPEQVFCPLQADSSQLSVVLAASKGKDFVLIGPPGTGKSQTIANLIAQCLAEGKKVLFVAEKIAALEVVHRRLKEVGLGEFCLELHSNKTRKQEVLERLQVAWSARGDVDQETWKAEAARLRGLREGLNVYVQRLHMVQRNGLTVFRAIAQVAAGEDLPRVGLAWSASEIHDRRDLNGLRDLVGRLEVNARAVCDLVAGAHPLRSITCVDWSPIWQQRLVQAALELSDRATGLGQAAEAFLEATGLPGTPLRHHSRTGLGLLASTLPEAHGRDWRFTLRPGARALGEQLETGAALVAQHRALTGRLSPGWSPETIRLCREGLKLLGRRKELRAQLGPAFHPDIAEELQRGLALLEVRAQEEKNLSVRYTDQVESLDIHVLQRTWNEGEASRWPLSWLKKRKVEKALVAVAQGEGRVIPGIDVHTLARMRTLHASIDALDLGGATDGVWNGRRTSLRNGNAALHLQAALVQARQGFPFKDRGFEPVAEGRCGERLAHLLDLLRSIAATEEAIIALDELRSATNGLWEGLATREDRLEAALNFWEDLGSVREAGPLTQAHPLVASGECGAALAADLDSLRERSQLEVLIARMAGLGEVTAGLWAGLDTDSAEVARALDFLEKVTRACAEYAGSLDEGTRVKAALERLLGEGSHLLDPAGPTMTHSRSLVSALAPLPEALKKVGQLGSLGPDDLQSLEGRTPEELKAWGRDLASKEVRIKAWCAWQKARKEGEAGGLGPLIRALEEGRLAPGNLLPAFETDYCRWWLNAHVDGDDVIRSFVSAEHEQRIQDFRALEARFTDLTREWVRSSLCASIPDPENLPRNSDWGVLRREVAKKKRHLPLRSLLADCPQAVTTLAPCLLMSPLSIAQYLAPNTDAFDLVVFDEASQIPVWDAIGAIARGKQAVIVGDPKQLPPTNFFNRAEAEPEEADVEEDLESILDECLGASLPTLELKWHYRSRHESLIAFSNFHYYKGRLITFPSPVTRDNAVSFHPVAGVYERSGARINKPEAQALVDDVVGRLRSGEFLHSRLTIGVVTFNAEQKTLIENLLDEARRRYPTIEPFFSDAELERVFVKNLESVQGDERDIIYFSTTYGPDHSGVVSMNFGPLNKDGGERRLNVAITRARLELRVFSSLRADQINLSRTQALGVRDLKYFLDYAERGSRALAEEARLDREGFDSPFEEAVAKALQRKGWEIHTQVGVSVFRIDLAVVHPDLPGSFLAGVECDGATYHRSATARDRDLLRELQLRRLGWEILRVWSTDWWIDPEGTLDALHRKLEEVHKAKQVQVGAEGDGEPTAASPGQEEALQVVANAWEDDLGLSNGSTHTPEGDGVSQAAPVEAGIVTIEEKTFFGKSYDSTLAWMIGEIVEAEGPILDAALAKRIARRHGWQRTGSRIQDRVETIAAQNHRFTREDVGRFFWPKALPPGAPVPHRSNWAILGRSADEICIQELMELAREVQRLGGRDSSNLTMMGRALGLGRLTVGPRERLERALHALEAEERGPCSSPSS
jgi:very-short-patch-repair endonuclease